MADKALKKECSVLKRKLCKIPGALSPEDVYFISPRLYSAKKALSFRQDPDFCSSLYEKLKLWDFSPDKEKLCAFIRGVSAPDPVVRALRAYLTLCFCRGIGEGRELAGKFREAEKLDLSEIISECSPLERSLALYPDYAASDDATRKQYRLSLYRLAKKRRRGAAEVLRGIPYHKLTETLFSDDKYTGGLYFAALFSVFSFFLSLLYILCGNIIPVLLCVLPLYELSKYFTGMIFSKLIPAKTVLRLREDEKLPGYLIVVTALFGDGTEKLKDRLEALYFTEGKTGSALFGVLADLPDGKTKETEDDAELISKASAAVSELNEKYGERFYLFYRGRRYSQGEEAYIAPERKRGAICELVKLIRGESSDLRVKGDEKALYNIPYIITLDSDTLLYPGSARSMILAAAHPYNRPRIDHEKRTVIKGHGIMQPVMRGKLPTDESTAFSRYYSPDSGMEAYHGTSFDTLSAVFGRGSFCGKGVIDTAAFYECACDIFPKERILSHDAAEGGRCRCGALTDTVMYEGSPKNALSYYRRLDRWVRGDIQSLFLSSKRFRGASGKKIENGIASLDRYLLCDSVLRDLAPVFSVLALFSGAFLQKAFVVQLFAVSYIAVPEILYMISANVSQSDRAAHLISLFMKLSFIFYEAQTVLIAALTAAFRILSGKHLLKWTTASSSDRMKDKNAAYIAAFFPSLLFGVFSVFASGGGELIPGALIAFSPVTAGSASFYSKKRISSEPDADFLKKCAADHMKYFIKFVNAEHNYLPPDNYQKFGDVGIAARTSPTNIGLYLLSVIAAADLKIILPDGIYGMIAPTLRSLSSLPKRGGKLYNWYDTRTSSVLSGFVSTVDCGNYLCCLITLRAALEEYEKDDPRLSELYGTLDGLINECDLSELYDEKTGLFRIGYGGGTDNFYDLYESEMHTTDILAVALGYAPPSHLSHLGRPVLKKRGEYGVASWGGTAFEYFMPSLFLPSPAGSLCDHALRFACKAQKRSFKTVNGSKIYGTSESCYFSFDCKMNYQYKAHGVRSLSISEYGNDPVISPYSAFLMLGRDRNAENVLKTMKKLGIYGEYGFYEAIDLTPSRTGKGYAIIKCHMAHHMGMSIIAAANRVCGGVFVKRFCKDKRVSAVLPLLYEKMPSKKAVIKKSPALKTKPKAVFYDKNFTQTASAATNTVLTVIADKYGAGLYKRDICICRHDAEGMRKLTLLCRGTRVFDLLSYPSKFTDEGVTYDHDGMRAYLSVFKNRCVFSLSVNCSSDGAALCFEPILAQLREYEMHSAYSGLFLTFEYENGILYIIRRPKSGKGVCIAIAAVSGGLLPLKHLCRADEIYEKSNNEELFDTERSSEGSACVFPRIFAKAVSGDFTFYIAAAEDKPSAKAEMLGALSVRLSSGKRADVSDLPETDPAVFERILKCFMRPPHKTAAVRCDNGYRALLYKHGISGDRPIMLIDCRGEGGMDQFRTVFPAYAQAIVRALICGITFDTVIIYDGDDGYFDKKSKEADRMIGSSGLLSLKNDRIFTVNADDTTAKLLSSICFYRVSAVEKDHSTPEKCDKRDICLKKKEISDISFRFEDGAAVLPAGKGYRPQSFIYSNKVFGALVTDRSGGYCYYNNSRMLKLTDHDTTPGGAAEKLILSRGGVKYDLFSYADECRFYLSCAEWSGEICGEKYKVTLSVDGISAYKAVKIVSDLDGELSYCADMVLGEKFINGSLRYAVRGDTVFVGNALQPGLPEFFVNCSDPCAPVFDGRKLTVKTAFRKECVFTVGAVFSKSALDMMLLTKDLSEKRYAARVRKFLSPFTLRSGDMALDRAFNVYAPYQALFCRTYARCGYYQSGGAYGFRDQLQDCLCTVYGAPLDVKAHILRCAAHQYREGDVMHWFHPVTNTGVRTRCSDDMLWLPFTVYKYVRVTGDIGIVKTKIRYLSSPPLEENERDRYEPAVPGEEKGTLEDHCRRALSRIKTGSHGLCLVGGGDWNDGMNEIGIKGRGESVWLSFFAADCLRKFASLLRISGKDGADGYEKKADILLENIEKYGYDGEHYIRGYLDGGTPFGKTGDRVCETDVLPQAAAAIVSNDKERVKIALDSAYEKLFDRENKIFRLFYPPFDGEKDIGYITAYPPGIRENGGQYTHGAIWGAIGFLEAGQNDRGYEILHAIEPSERKPEIYENENYVFSGDVYTADGVYGKGGWSWYTGSAGWYFVAVLEHLLGYREHDGGFEISPRFCSEFGRFTLTVKRHGTEYVIRAENREKTAVLDGAVCEKSFFSFDGGTHTLDLGVK